MLPVPRRHGARRTQLFILLVLTLALGCGQGAPPPVPEEAPATTGIEGRVRWQGPATPSSGIVPEGCGDEDPRPVRVGADGGLGDVVAVVPGSVGAAAPPELSLEARGCRYSRGGAVVGPNATLRVSNHDSIVHTFHLRRTDGTSIQNLAAVPGGPPLRWTLPASGTVLVESDHFDWMRATIRIVDGDAWATSDADGRFALPDVAPGLRAVELSHPAFGTDTRAVTVPPDGPAALYVDYP